jgi:hypothetical protein
MQDPSLDHSANGWLLTPTTNLIEFIANETAICGLTLRVLAASDIIPDLLTIAAEKYASTNPGAVAAIEKLMEGATTDAAFAKDEVAKGFSTILSHHAIAVWAGIETAIEQTLVNLIRKAPSAAEVILKVSPELNAERVKTKTANDAAKALSMWTHSFKGHSLERDLAMLGAFGVNVKLSIGHRQALVEMSEVRNVLLHNGGFVDAKLLEKVTWLSVKAGQQLKVTQAGMAGYFDAAHAFANAMIAASLQSPYVAVHKKSSS